MPESSGIVMVGSLVSLREDTAFTGKDRLTQRQYYFELGVNDLTVLKVIPPEHPGVYPVVYVANSNGLKRWIPEKLIK